MLMEKTLATLEFEEGKVALKGEIEDLVNTSLAQGRVQCVDFSKFSIL
jgi:flagellar basal body-associated protein FliL